MSKLSPSQKDFMGLLLRSPDEGDGWRRVSDLLTPFAQAMLKENPELFETESREKTFYVRLTERGSIVCEYL